MTAPTILTPLTMRGLTARNRLWLPPMCMYCVDSRDGVVTDWHVLHYATRATGGFGTVIAEATAVTPNGRLSPFDLGLWDDAQVAGHRRIVEAIHAAGSVAGVQLGHGGRKAGTPPWRPGGDPGTRTTTIEGWDLVAPSAIAYPKHAEPRALSEDEVRATTAAFAAAARRAVQAGYDVVELHGAHGYLIHEFLSPLSNTRDDEFGGSPAGRRAAELVVAGVGQGREELVDEVAVGPVQLDDVVAGLYRPARGRGEGGRRRADLVLGERARLGVLRVGDGAGCHQVPALDGGRARSRVAAGAPRGSARLAAAVTELDAGDGAGGVDRLHDAAVPGDLRVVPQPQVEGGQATVGGHRRGLRDHGAETACGARGVVQDVPVGDDAVPGVDAVHAHGRQPQAVARGQAAHGQRRQDGRRCHETHATRRGPLAVVSAARPACRRRRSARGRRVLDGPAAGGPAAIA